MNGSDHGSNGVSPPGASSGPTLDDLEKLGAQDVATVVFSFTKTEMEKLREAFRDEPRTAFDVLFEKVCERREDRCSDREVVETAIRWAQLLSTPEQGALLKALENKPKNIVDAMVECNQVVDAYVKQRTEQGDRT